LEALKSTLGEYYRISIQDGRVFIGAFTCMDKAKNIILTHAEEFYLESPGVYSSGQSIRRYVGMIMIPWRYVITAEVEMIG
ncbi:hypothetical protein DL93DRAFT_2051684, partial [Clavulina sp. PMI_390]